MAYRIDLKAPDILVPCTFVPSVNAPGKMLCINEKDDSLLVVEPDGSQTRSLPPGHPDWDSPYTWATVIGDFLVYRSATPETKGVPRAYRMIT